MSYIQDYGDRFNYFDRCLGFPDWKKISILDFGGNSGNLLRDRSSQIPHENYSCLDISKDAVELGKKDFPNAKWHHYDRWNPRFNPDGEKDLEIPKLGYFDLTIACSVFTHTTESDMLSLVKCLKKQCHTLAFTIMTPDVAFYYAKKRTPSYNEERLKKEIIGLKSFYLVNDDQIYADDPRLKKAHSFYYIVEQSRIHDIFPSIQIYPPIGNEIQHCCVLSDTSTTT